MKNKQSYLLFAIVFFTAICFYTGSLPNHAATARETPAIGLFTRLQLALGSNDGEVFAVAENRFTLLPSTVEVYVELYRSETQTDDCAKMSLVAFDYTPDLDMGQTVSASASTDGRPCFWKGRVRYRVNGSQWVERTTQTFLADLNGNFS